MKKNSIIVGDCSTMIEYLNSFALTSITPPTVIKSDRGLFHQAQLLSDGSIRTQGDNRHGQLGNPSSLPRVIDLVCGYYTTYVLTSTGDLLGCGERYFGQLGSHDDSSSFVQLSSKITTIGGYGHYLYLVNDRGELYSCGYDYDGTLSRSTSTVKEIRRVVDAPSHIVKIQANYNVTYFLTRHAEVHGRVVNQHNHWSDFKLVAIRKSL